jgi:hypothetical protein
MDHHDVNSRLMKLADRIKNSEKFLSGMLVGKARKLAEAFPYDNTVVDMYHFLDKRSQKQAMISRAELQEAYNQLYTRNNQFIKSFASELGVQPEFKKEASLAKPEGDLVKDYQDKYSDPVLKNALASLVNGKPVQMYSKQNADNALRNTKKQLEVMKLPAAQLEVIAGNEQFIICRAGFQTPKGDVSVLVPLKSENNNLCFPTSFVTNAGLKELTPENLSKHIVESAGKFLQVNAKELLSFLSKKAEPLNSVQEAIIKQKLASYQQMPFSNVGIFYKEAYLSEKPEVQEIKYQVPSELTHFTEQLGSAAGSAEFVFGKVAVDGGRDFIVRKLAKLGFNQSQVKVAKTTDTSIIYAVSLLDKAFSVPVAVENKQIKEPKIIIANGAPKGFTFEAITDVLKEATDSNALLKSSIYFDSNLGELNKQLHNALYDKNFKVAGELLHVLSEKNQDSFKEGLELYKKALNGETIHKVASAGCTHSSRSQNSIHPICCHLGLPVNKVYQDKHGQCRPLYRKNAEDSKQQRPEFLNSNILIWNDQ